MPIITCPNCGAKNRVQEKAGLQPVCGKCGTKLRMAQQSVVEITDANFASTINGTGEKPVLIDCWAEWCGPCRMVAPTIEQIAREAAGRWVVGKLDVDRNPRVAQQFQISSIPTMLIFRGGQLVDQIVGLHPKDAILSHLEQAAQLASH